MSRRISQETFDAVVRESMVDFGLSREEALRDALAQLLSQGVDLSGIDTTGGEGLEELESLWTQVRASGDGPAKADALRRLQQLCSDSDPNGVRNQHILRSRGWLNDLLAMLEEDTQVVEVLLLLQTLVRQSTELRDMFEPRGADRLVGLLRRLLPPEASRSESLEACFKLASAAAKSEFNKSSLFKQGLGGLILEVLKVNDESLPGLTRSVCHAMTALSTHDDFRSEISCAMDNGKFFLNGGAVPLLLGIVSRFKQSPSEASAALSACKQLILTEEAVQIVALHGGMELPRKILSESDADPELVRSVLGLARNMCADDNRKNQLASDGTLELIVRAIDSEPYLHDSSLVENGIACLAAMSLRFPANSFKIVNCGAINVVVAGMERHASRPVLNRQACIFYSKISRNALYSDRSSDSKYCGPMSRIAFANSGCRG